MKEKWSEVALGEVLVPRDDTLTIHPELSYREITVAWWGKGVRLRRAVLGAEVAASDRNIVRTGDFIISKIDARHGAYGFVPPELDGGIVTNDFPVYQVKIERMTPRWLYWLTQRAAFSRMCEAASEGSTRRVRVSGAKFDQLRIPLPPLVEQQRIVAHLDAIESRLTRAQKFRDESSLESLALIRSMIQPQHCAGVKPVPMHELVTWRSPDVIVSQSDSYIFAGVYCFGRGVFRKEAVSGMDFAYNRLTRLRTGEFTYPKLMAWEGALGIVPPDCDGCYVSPEYPVFTVNESKVLPEILDIHFKTPAVWKDLAAISTGTNLRRRRLNPNAFLDYQFPLPPLEVQRHVKVIADRAATKRKLQKDAASLEKAIIPSMLDRIFS